MYAAYQSHQSWGGATASKAPWRSSGLLQELRESLDVHA